MSFPNAPAIDINLFDLTVYSPQLTQAIVGCVGPATKGPTNQLTTFTDEGNFVNFHGQPANSNMYAPRGAIRYLHLGNRLTFVRVAGANLQAASVTLFDATGLKPILIVTASSQVGPSGGKGSWANNGQLQVAITYNGPTTSPTSYNVLVFFQGQQIANDRYLSVTNGTVVTTVNNGSTRISVQLASGAGATFPAQTVNPVTGALQPVNLTGGDDGAFAKTDSLISTTGGIAGKRFYGKRDTIAGNRVWQNILTITPSLASKAIIYGTVNMPVTPGTFTIRVQTAAGPTFVELADSGAFGYGPGGSGLGQLVPSSGSHTGFIDYRTGRWGVKLSAATAFLNGTIDGIWTRANSESVGAAVQGNGTYAGNISDAPCAPGYYTANKVLISVPIKEQVGVDATGGASDSNTTAGLKTLAGWIVPGTVVLTPSHPTLSVPNPVYDDGFGGFRTGPNGTGLPLTGSINYRTGVWSVTWDPTGPAMPAGGVLTAQYALLVIDMGGGPVPGILGTWVSAEVDQPSAAGGGATVSSTDSGAQAIIGPIKRATVRMTISATSNGPFTVYDDGLGGWLSAPRGEPDAVAVTGSINYSSGAWTITLPSGTVTAAATIKSWYVSAFQDEARRALRGPGPEILPGGGPFSTSGTTYADPAVANAFNGSTYFDHTTGAFAFQLNVVPLGAGTQSFDVQGGAALTAVYLPAEILGWGDGTATTFTGVLDNAPFRRNANRLQGMQGNDSSLAGSGDPTITFSTLNATPPDYWAENVALPTNPANFVNYATGAVSIPWTGAPPADAAVYVAGEETVLNADALYPGDIGNQRPVLNTGFYIQVDADPTLAGTLRFQTFFNGAVQESFGQAPDLPTLIALVNDPTNGSKLVTVRPTAASTFLSPDVGAAQQSGLAGAFTMADIIGTKVGSVTTGLQMFSNVEAVPVNWIIVPGQWHAPIISALQQLCEKKGRRCMAFVPSPDLPDPFQHRDFFDGQLGSGPGGVAIPSVLVPYPPLVAINSRQLATVTPWVQYFDSYANQNVFEPPDGDAAGLVAFTPAPWFPIAGLKRGKLNILAVRYSAASDDRDLVYGPVGNVTEVVNSIIVKVGVGPVLVGQRTTQRNATHTDRINVSWTVNVLMNLLDQASSAFEFEINDAILWRQIAANLNNTLKPIIARRGLQDAYVVVDGTTTTPDDVDQLKVNGKIFIKPALATEYITYDLILTPTGADFSTIVTPG